jgi:predicted ester cyclase
MSYESDQVRKFYELVWNQHNRSVIPEILHEQIKFRGSLGQEKHGHTGFVEYLDMIHDALGDYQCVIEELVSEPPKVFAKMKFTGIHKGQFMGCQPTGKRLSWFGAALFTFSNGKIIDLWVLSNLKSLEAQLEHNET